MAVSNNRVQLPSSYNLTDENGKCTTQWYFYFQNLAGSLPPVGSGYVIDGSLGTNGYPITLFFGLASARGTTPAAGSVYYAVDTGQTFISTGAGWIDQTPALVGDISKPAHSNVTTLATITTPGTVGSTTTVPIITIDSKGRVTSHSEVPIPPATAGGENGQIQINIDGVLFGDPSFTFDSATSTVDITDLHIADQITFDNPELTFNNLSPLTTKGDLLAYSTSNVREPVGSDGQVLSADSTSATGLSWQSTGIAEYLFSFGDATPKNLLLINANKIIKSVDIIIMTAFDDITSTLSIGTVGSPTGLMDTTDNQSFVTGTYTVEPAIKFGSATQIVLAINALTSTMGNGLVVITYQI